MKTDLSGVERLYSHFLGRDIGYLFAGGLLVCVVEYALWGEIFLPQGISLELIGFLIGSHFIGLIISELGSEIGRPLKNIELPNEDYQTSLPFYQDLVKNYDDRVLNQYERMVFMMVAGAAIGTSSLLGGLFMIVALCRPIFNAELPSYEDILLTVGLLICGYFTVRNSERQKKKVQNELKSLTNGIVTNNKVSEA